MVEKITDEDIKKFEIVRRSGITNMFNVSVVEALSGLSPEKQKEIWKIYESDEERVKKVIEKYDEEIEREAEKLRKALIQ
jgi:gas vesicle protein